MAILQAAEHYSAEQYHLNNALSFSKLPAQWETNGSGMMELDDLSPPSKVSSTFPCPKCHLRYPTKAKLYSHTTQAHNWIFCKICSKKMQEKSYKEHLTTNRHLQ